MLTFVQVQALLAGILQADNATKQQLGRRFAQHLGLQPGPGGPDDGIDGSADIGGRLIHFQCKLRGTELDRDDARAYYSDLQFHRAAISVMLAGKGYKETFRERLFGHPHLEIVRIHLLALEDLFLETPAYQAARADLPLMVDLAQIAAPRSQ
jgi:hypothetical protein